MHVEVALPLPVAQTFTYRLEDDDLPAPGTRVLVPFQRTESIGWVVGPGDPTGISGIRGVLDVLEREPSVPADLMRLARWISRYYVASLGLTLRSMLPALLSDRAREFVWLTAAGARALEGGRGDEGISGRAAAVLACLERAGGRAHDPCPAKEARSRLRLARDPATACGRIHRAPDGTTASAAGTDTEGSEARALDPGSRHPGRTLSPRAPATGMLRAA